MTTVYYVQPYKDHPKPSDSNASHHSNPTDYQSYPEDYEAGPTHIVIYSAFSDASERNYFARKVLATVGLQLLFLTILIAAAIHLDPVREFFISQTGALVAIFSAVLFLVLYIGIVCCGLGRGKPNVGNVSLLIVLTISLSVFATYITLHYDVPGILIAAATTVGVVTLLFLIVLFTDIDITSICIIFFGATIALLLFALITFLLAIFGVIPIDQWPLIKTMFCGIIAVIYAVSILWDLKLIIGGGKYKLEESDWLFASSMLFADIVGLFLKLLELQQHIRGG